MSLFFLLLRFAQIGLFAIGGGLATLPFLFELAEDSDWLTHELIGNMLAVAQSLPGAIGVNLVAYVGFQRVGFVGALVAALGLISPSIVIIIFVARILNAFKANVLVKAVFSGLRPAAGGILLAASFGAIKLSLYNSEFSAWYEVIRWRDLVLFVALFFCIHRFEAHPIFYIAASGVVGIALEL
ncbi:MAG: chromate transporter [Treponema sp.]|jgi:chromate transporter|nr:chromate transporter [Treponema sp.]